MTRTWSTTGKAYTEGQEARLILLFEKMEWHELPYQLPAMPGLAINKAIEVFHLTARRVAYSDLMAPYALLGIEAVYSNGYSRIYLVDTGTKGVVLASEFYSDDEDDKQEVKP